MGYRNIMISNAVNFHIRNEQFILDMEEEVSIPLEDINCIMIECQSVNMSAYFLQKVAENGIAVYLCDGKHTPNAVVLPMVRHSRHFKMLKNQIELNRPFQKRLWQQIVIQKILNQAKCMELNEVEGYQELQAMSRQVQSGDRTNIEAKAAAFYFRRIFGDYFIRSEDNIINAVLNYGYAILRGLVARTIIIYGFEPAIGLFHHSELNSYNLADDLIEPFRPLVDQYVIQNFEYLEVHDELTPSIKRELFNLLNYDMEVCGEKHSINNSIDKVVMSLSSCLDGRREDLMLPELIPFTVHQYE